MRFFCFIGIRTKIKFNRINNMFMQTFEITKKTPNGMVWTHGHTSIAFPELTTDIIKYIDKNKENGNKLRMQFLRKCIEKLSTKSTSI